MVLLRVPIRIETATRGSIHDRARKTLDAGLFYPQIAEVTNPDRPPTNLFG
jgi:hypothetical protein